MVLIFKPDTLLRWHRKLVKGKWTFKHQSKRGGRPPIELQVVQLVLQLARENNWSDDRITGELKKLSYRISHETVRQILRRHDIPLVPQQQLSSTWRTFLNHYKDTLLACDFFTIETIRLQTLYVFFFIKVGTGRVHIADITAYATQSWMSQQVRQIVWNLQMQQQMFTHVIRDNDGKYSTIFDVVFASEGIETVHTPIRAPQANAYAERWVRSVREECLDLPIILNTAHLKYVLHEYEGFFNTAQPHQGIGQKIPDPLPRSFNHRNGQTACTPRLLSSCLTQGKHRVDRASCYYRFTCAVMGWSSCFGRLTHTATRNIGRPTA